MSESLESGNNSYDYLMKVVNTMDCGLHLSTPSETDMAQLRDVQYEAHKTTMGGLYPRPCRAKILEVFAPSPGETKRVLDLGSGSGAW
ncbi:hypothetical protein CPB86DRAFT_815304 [Serendipita vermifera]|nr:hypothetical protein CPB86DRAFT_815304 [Serendipita vermifera]